MHPPDIWRTARLLVDRHGNQALGEAWVRVMSLRQGGDEQGAVVWQRIHEAGVEQCTLRDPGEARH